MRKGEISKEMQSIKTSLEEWRIMQKKEQKKKKRKKECLTKELKSIQIVMKIHRMKLIKNKMMKILIKISKIKMIKKKKRSLLIPMTLSINQFKKAWKKLKEDFSWVKNSVTSI
jgi:hypothetical protein